MAKEKITAKDVTAAAAKAASKATKRGKELLAKVGERTGKANKALREMKHRRIVDAAEVAVGGALAGAIHGADMYIDTSPEDKPGTGMQIPYGLPGGLAMIGAGVALKSYDLQAAGLGAATFGIGRMAEDYVSDMAAKAKAEADAKAAQ